MITTWLQIASLCAALVGPIQDQKVEERIALKNLTAPRIMFALKENHLIFRGLSLGMRTGADPSELILVGSRNSVDQAREILRLLDVAPKRILLDVRLVRIRRDGANVTEETLSELKTLASNNRTLAITGSDETWESEAKILPRINGDDTISLRVWISLKVGDHKLDFTSVGQRQHVGQSFVVTAISGRSFSHLPRVGPLDANDSRTLGSGYRVEAKVVEIK
jgi:hypothetical protein